MLIQNAVKIILGSESWVQSVNPTQVLVHRFDDNKHLEISGGVEHLKRSGTAEIKYHYVDWSIYDTDDYELITERLLYKFNDKLQPLKRFSLDELKEILEQLPSPKTETLVGRTILFLISAKCLTSTPS